MSMFCCIVLRTCVGPVDRLGILSIFTTIDVCIKAWVIKHRQRFKGLQSLRITKGSQSRNFLGLMDMWITCSASSPHPHRPNNNQDSYVRKRKEKDLT